jgi:hypothetical protein
MDMRYGLLTRLVALLVAQAGSHQARRGRPTMATTTSSQPFPPTTVQRPDVPLSFLVPWRPGELGAKPALIEASSSPQLSFRERVHLRNKVTDRLRSSNGLTPADACVPGLEP